MSVSLSSMPNGGSPVRLPNIGLRGGQATRPQSVKRAIPRSTTKISSIEQIRPSSKSPSSLSPPNANQYATAVPRTDARGCRVGRRVGLSDHEKEMRAPGKYKTPSSIRRWEGPIVQGPIGRFRSQAGTFSVPISPGPQIGARDLEWLPERGVHGSEQNESGRVRRIKNEADRGGRRDRCNRQRRGILGAGCLFGMGKKRYLTQVESASFLPGTLFAPASNCRIS